MDDPEQMEEERRLCYVGMTRAEQRLYLVRAFRRTIWGNADVRDPSRFLGDIPPELVEGGGRYAPSPPSTASQTRPRRPRELFAHRRERVQQARDRQPAIPQDRADSGDRGRRPSGKRPTADRDGLETRFRPGEKVSHPLFGPGIVIASERVGDDEEVTVAFPQEGIKRLMAQYANLAKDGASDSGT